MVQSVVGGGTRRTNVELVCSNSSFTSAPHHKSSIDNNASDHEVKLLSLPMYFVPMQDSLPSTDVALPA